ncbi:MAG: adenylate cyclase [Chlamydiae bacterium CG10_big_fil_rev_8_21_14_0_10_42_34]|nr:MAG: adenylate cyclase [Chlamydiae bacterium CG10_big_fil_rev_8_21_14_0_10_42_34]
MKNPRLTLKSSLLVQIYDPDEVVFFNDLGPVYRVKGKPYVLIAKLLEKSSLTADQVASQLEKYFPQKTLLYALYRLEKRGLIEQAQTVFPKNFSAFCNLLGKSPEDAYCKLQKIKIDVYAVGNVQTEIFENACQSMFVQCQLKKVQAFASGIHEQKSDEKFSRSRNALSVVITDHYRHESIKTLHDKFLQEQHPWVLVCPSGPQIWIGPLFIFQKTSCFKCLSYALQMNQVEEILFEERAHKSSPISMHTANLPTAEPIAINLLVNELFKWIILGENERLEGKMLTLNLLSFELQSHKVIQRCGCAPTESVQLGSNLSDFQLEKDAPKEIPPEVTYKKYKHLISPITGITNFLNPIHSPESSLFHNYYAGINLADYEYLKRAPLSDGWKTAGGGKGASDIQAKTSCLCEAIERHSGVFQGNERRIQASFEELQQTAIHPSSVLHFSDTQYQSRELWNQTCDRFHFIPTKFTSNKKVDWSPIWSLTYQCWKWIPTAMCYYAYPFIDNDPFCRGDSNGCAAGNSITEAVLSALLELIERDSIALWWYPRIKKRAVDILSFEDPYFFKLVTFYKSSLNRNVWALDLTTDLNVPTFGAISADQEGRNIMFGFGAHLNAHLAMRRALTEMNQSYSIFESVKTPKAASMRKTWLTKTSLENQPYLVPLPDAALKKKDYPFYPQDDFQKNLQTCQKIVEDQKMEVLVLNQTRSYIGMPVCRVIVPGLRHFWNRYADGRLYDVPIKMGWLKNKTKEADLNPIPMFI